MLVNEKGPDIFGACETFLDANVSDDQIAINGFEFLRKDRCVTVDKMAAESFFTLEIPLPANAEINSKFQN